MRPILLNQTSIGSFLGKVHGRVSDGPNMCNVCPSPSLGLSPSIPESIGLEQLASAGLGSRNEMKIVHEIFTKIWVLTYQVRTNNRGDKR